MTKKLSQSVLDKIKKGHVAPRPRWHFMAKNGLFWLAFAIAAIIGGQAIGVMILSISNLDMGLLPQLQQRALLGLRVIPLFWIIFLLAFLLLAALGLHQTDKGYKVSTPKLIGLNLLISLVIGLGSFAAGDAERFEDFFERNAPLYQGMAHHQERAWNQPDAGTLAGTIVKIKDDKTIILEDRTGKKWEVKYEEARMEITKNIKVKAVGERAGSGKFEAELLAPFRHGPMEMKENLHKMRSKW